MFDVSWTDPTRETVGQRKHRKESKDHHTNEAQQVRYEKGSESNGSFSQNRPSLLNLFGGTSKTNIVRSGSHSKLSTLRNDEKQARASRRISSYTISSILSEHISSTSSCPPTNFFAMGPPHSETGQLSGSEGDEGSIFSERTSRSAKSGSTWSSIGDSPIFQNRFRSHRSSDVDFVPRQAMTPAKSSTEVEHTDERFATLVSISSFQSTPIEITGLSNKHFISPKAGHPSLAIHRDIDSLSTPHCPITEISGSKQIDWPMPPQINEATNGAMPDNYVVFPSELPGLPPSSPLDTLPSPTRSVRRTQSIVELTHLQRHIRRMDTAGPRIILERLKEQWLEVADASVYREMELEKQLWMLTALQHYQKSNPTDTINQSKIACPDEGGAVSKLLSLYENHASACFLSALKPTPRIHHISTSPLSPTGYPNIRPLFVPTPTANLPYASNLFSSIHAFSIAAVLPASSIPPMLRECRRTLCSARPPRRQFSSVCPASPRSLSSYTLSKQIVVPPGRKLQQEPGAIHLTIIDPVPLSNTLGPKLRTWLDAHLIMNLERQFKCINPGRLFPIWLADAGLRGEGSTIFNINFRAVVIEDKDAGEYRNSDAEADLKEELRSVVGRMLWKEMWGSFVEGERWWWDDEGIIEECKELGTRWEYSIIKGVREG